MFQPISDEDIIHVKIRFLLKIENDLLYYCEGIMYECVENALRYIRSKPELVAFVRDFDSEGGSCGVQTATAIAMPRACQRILLSERQESDECGEK